MRELPPTSLKGFDPKYGVVEYEWGDPLPRNGEPWKDHQYHAEILSWHEHDYLGIHAFMQVWDYGQQDDPDQRWQYMLLLLRPARHIDEEGFVKTTGWSWVIRTEYETTEEQRFPTHAQVGADIDLWLTTPEYLRFILE
jgi:hypothetical protein